MQRAGQTSIPPTIYVFAGVVLLRLVVLHQLSASAFLLPNRGDMHFYNDWALRILHGQWTDGHAFYGLPLYPYLLAVIYRVFGYNPYLPGFLQACADGGTAVILYKLAVRIFDDRTDSEAKTEPQPGSLRRGEIIGLLAVAGWAFFVPEQAYSAILMPTALAVFVFWFVVWQIVRRNQRPSYLRTFGLGALIGFSAMGVATILFAPPLIFAALFLKSRNAAAPFRSSLVACLLLVSGLGLGISPCWLHNRFVAHDSVILSAHSGVNLWIGNNPHATGYPQFPPGLHAGQEAMLGDSIDRAEAAAGRPLKRGEVSTYWSRQARSFIRENTAQWLGLIATKIANFWNAFQYDDLSIITNFGENGIILPGLKFGLVAVLALPGVVFAFNKFPSSRWILAAVLLHNASLLTVFVTERYRLAAIPGLLLFAAFGLSELWLNCLRLRYSSAIAYCGLLGLSTFFLSIPRKDSALWALDPYNSGWQALESKNLTLARRQLDLAYAYVPTNAEVNFARGNLSLEEGDRTAAQTSYLATLQLDPTHEGAWNNLGVLALQENQPQRAAKLFGKALEQNPRDAKTYFLFARASLNAGDTTAAEAALAKALELQPTQQEFIALQKEITERLRSP